MATREEFKKNLPYYMDLAGVNQVELAKAVGVSKSTVSTWLSGRSYPRIDVIQKTADVLNCTTDDLVTENTEVIRQTLSEDAFEKWFAHAKNVEYVAPIYSQKNLLPVGSNKRDIIGKKGKLIEVEYQETNHDF